MSQTELDFDRHRGGKTYDDAQDRLRLNKQQRRIYDAMRDGAWRTLREIEAITGDPQASISARLRDFRKEPLHWQVLTDRGTFGKGTYRYRLITTPRPDETS